MDRTENKTIHSIPGQYGIPRPWYFPFTRTYWCGEKENENISTPLSKKGNAEGTNHNYYYQYLFVCLFREEVSDTKLSVKYCHQFKMQMDDASLYVSFQTITYVIAKMLLSLFVFYPQLCVLRRSQATSNQEFTSRIW